MKKFSTILIALVAYLQVYAIFPMQITNNSQYDDTDIYIGIIGKRLDGSDIYYNLRSNSASGVTLADLNESVNTLHKVDGDTFTNCTEGQKLSVACKWMYAGGDTHTPYIDYVVTNGATGLEIASAAVSARKILYNGRLYILVGETLYSVTGETIKK